MTEQGNTSARHVWEGADLCMVGWMRLALATAASLTVFIDPESLGGSPLLISVVFCSYVIYSLLFYSLAQHRHPFFQTRTAYWLDVAWYALIVYFTGGSESYFFLFFLFAI